MLVVLLLVSAGAAAQTLVPRVTNLAWPWSVALLPDGRFLISEREGRLLLVHRDGSRTVLEGTPATLFAGQGGYLDVILDSRFASNRYVYLSYAEGTPQENGLAVFRARLQDDRLHEGRQILRVAQDKSTPQHYGGRMLMVDDHLIITSGDGFEHREDAQDLDSELGKVLRVDRDGQPAGMPGERGDPLRIWTRGHRNPQGLAVDPGRGLVYLHEHGPRGGDEINVLKGGENYGWPLATHGVNYSGAYVSPFRSVPGATDPIWTWTPSIAPSGLAYYAGNRIPQWRDSLLVGALVDREVRRLKVVDGVIVAEEALFSDLDRRIRDVRVFDERIFVLTDGENATLFEVMGN
jgi:glucose/arabinose dehydrogenase